MQIETEIDLPRLQRFLQPGSETTCPNEMKALFEAFPSLECTVLATVDGYRVAAAWRRTRELQMPRLAAIVGSLCGLGETLVRETGQETFRDVLIASRTGYSVVQRLPPPGQRLILLSTCSADTNLGMASNYTRTLATRLAKLSFTTVV